jgi:hypothetical protein
MATHPTSAEAQSLVKVREADPDEAAVIARYEALRAEPDSPEKRHATATLERLCFFRGPLVHAGRTYSYDRHEQSLYRSPKPAAAAPVRYGNKSPCVPRAGAAGTRGKFSQRKGG